MIIQKYDMCSKQKSLRYYLYNKDHISNLYNLTIFLMWRFNYVQRDGVLNFIKNHNDGIEFEEVNIDIDHQNNLVYFSESWHTYNNKPTTPEIKILLEEENFIQLCKMGFLDYIVMTKDNFIHILFAWDKILQKLPPFALLYQDENNWYDVLPFDTKQAMEQFVINHTHNNK